MTRIIKTENNLQLVHNPHDLRGYFVMSAVRRNDGSIMFWQQVSKNYIRKGWAMRELRRLSAIRENRKMLAVNTIMDELTACGLL